MKKFLLVLCFGFQIFLFSPLVLADGEKKKDVISSTGYTIHLKEQLGSNSDPLEAKNGVELIKKYIKRVYVYGASIIGILCVFILVISGIQISMGGANAEMVNQAKDRILQAIFSLILLFGSALILKTINPGFFDPNGGGTAQVIEVSRFV